VRHKLPSSTSPKIGTDPTRPHFLLVNPPVDVPAAILPCVSSATQPTVPFACCFRRFGLRLFFDCHFPFGPPMVRTEVRIRNARDGGIRFHFVCKLFCSVTDQQHVIRVFFGVERKYG